MTILARSASGKDDKDSFTLYARITLSYLALALLLRFTTFGNPILFPDEQFYLLTGSRMLHGALPYVDLWDRKPFGLFVLFSQFARIGDGLLAYQIAALIAVVTTSVLLYALARLIGGRPGAWIAGLAYPAFLTAFMCYGGQSEVFYNLPVAGAALIIANTIQRQSRQGLLTAGIVAMGLIGVALQIKTSTVFTGMAFGLVLMVMAHREYKSVGAVLGFGAIWALVALLPTIASTLYFVSIGDFGEYYYANVASNFGRHFAEGSWLTSTAKTVLTIIVLPVAIVFAIRQDIDFSINAKRQLVLFYGVWLISALSGFFFLGPY
jgi:hypothetical protein